MTAPSVAWLEGRVVAWADARIPIEDRGLQFGESVYEVVPITAGRARFVDLHWQRLRHGAEAIGVDEGVPDFAGFCAMLDTLLAHDPVREGIAYVQLTGGDAPRAHVAKDPPRPRLLAYLRELTYPRAPTTRRGIAVISVADTRWQRCDLKTTMLLPTVLAKRAARAAGVDDALLVGHDGLVHEAASANVFIVEGDRLLTPKQSPALLPGVTREVVRRVAASLGVAVREDDILLDRLRAADEVMLCSTTLLVMPVRAVDGIPIGSGVAGLQALRVCAGLRGELELDD